MKRFFLLKQLVCCILLLSSYSLFAQSEGFCFTKPSPDLLQTLDAYPKLNQIEGDIYIRLYPHIVTEDITSNNVQPFFDVFTAIETLRKDFEPHGIFFDIQCYDVIVRPDSDETEPLDLTRYIFNPSGNGCNSTTDVLSLTSMNAHDDGMDVYFLPPELPFLGGVALDIPSKALVLGGAANTDLEGYLNALTNTHILSHEMGHSLGLYHTHHGTCPENGCDPNEAPEDINQLGLDENGNCIDPNGCNCQITGDYICDTPADNRLSFIVGSTVSEDCQFMGSLDGESCINVPGYMPDVGNIMSYSRRKCHEDFTNGQAERIRMVCALYPEINMKSIFTDGFSVQPTIQIQSDECEPGIITLKIDDAHQNIPYSQWEWRRNGYKLLPTAPGVEPQLGATSGNNSVVTSITAVEIEPAEYTLTLQTNDCVQVIGVQVTMTDLGIEGDYQVTGFEVWENTDDDQTVTVDGQITIEEGGVLVIESGTFVEFMNFTGTILVKEGGRLVAENTVFRPSDCGTNETWWGMQVFGNPALNHDDSSNRPGTVQLTGGEIQNALFGILVGYPNEESEVEQFFSYSTGQTPGGDDLIAVVLASSMGPLIGGGLIQLDGVFLNNNLLGVVMGQTLHTNDNQSFIRNCTFRNDTEIDLFPEGDVFYYQIVLRQMATPFPIEGNSFKNSANPKTIMDDITGIYAFESAFTIGGECSAQRNVFFQLEHGVNVISNGAFLTMNITNNLFREIDKGVTLNNTVNAEILWNQFNDIPDGMAVTGGDDYVTHGVLTESAFLTTIQDNQFATNTAASNFKRALVIRNSEAEQDGLDFVVTNNLFDGDFVAATQFEQDNTDLGFTINCNDYDNNSALAWYLHSDCDMAVVGECDDIETQLAYRGSWHDIPANSSFPFHIWDASNTLTDINYRNNLPQILNNSVIPFSCGFPEPCIPSQNPCGGLRIAPIPPNSPAEPEEDRRYFVQQVQYKLANQDYIGVIQDLEQRQEVWSDKILVANYIQSANFTQATQILNRIPTNTADNIAFFDVMNSIVQQNMMANETLIRTYATDVQLNPRTNILAESVLSGYFNESYKRNASPIVAHSSKRGNSLQVDSKVRLNLIPNPTNNHLQISWNGQEGLDDLALHIFNSNGILVRQFPLNGVKGLQNVNIQELQEGVYFCYLKSAENIHALKKLMIIR